MRQTLGSTETITIRAPIAIAGKFKQFCKVNRFSYWEGIEELLKRAVLNRSSQPAEERQRNSIPDLFIVCRSDSDMTDEHKPAPSSLTIASHEEVAEILAYGLRYDEHAKPRRDGLDFAASFAADHLTAHLHRSGFVVMRRPPARPHSTG